jgi:hypothetical protein
MWAIVQDNQVVRTISTPIPLNLQGTQYPREIFNLWTVDELLAIGIYEVKYTKTTEVPAGQKIAGRGREIMEDHIREYDVLVEMSPADQEAEVLSAIAVKQQAVIERFNSLIEEGVPYAGTVIQVDDEARVNITAKGARAEFVLLGQGTWPEQFAWIDKYNAFLPLDAQGMANMALYIETQITKWRFNRRVHLNTLETLTTLAEVDAYDVETGWELIQP